MTSTLNKDEIVVVDKHKVWMSDDQWYFDDYEIEMSKDNITIKHLWNLQSGKDSSELTIPFQELDDIMVKIKKANHE